MSTRYNVSVVTEYEANGEKKSKWTTVGVAFPHKDGKGFNVELIPGVAVSGKFVVKEVEPREG